MVAPLAALVDKTSLPSRPNPSPPSGSSDAHSLRETKCSVYQSPAIQERVKDEEELLGVAKLHVIARIYWEH